MGPRSEGAFIQAVNALIDDAKKIEMDPDNAHLYDEPIIRHWANIRRQGIAINLFDRQTPLDGQARQLAMLARLQERMGEVDGAMIAELKRRFIVEGKLEKVTKAVNLLEFWLVMQDYVSLCQKQNPDFPSFPTILHQALDPTERDSAGYPSADGFVANVFSQMLMYHTVYGIDINAAAAAADAPKVTLSSLLDDDAGLLFNALELIGNPGSPDADKKDFISQLTANFRDAGGSKTQLQAALEKDLNGCTDAYQKLAKNFNVAALRLGLPNVGNAHQFLELRTKFKVDLKRELGAKGIELSDKVINAAEHAHFDSFLKTRAIKVDDKRLTNLFKL